MTETTRHKGETEAEFQARTGQPHWTATPTDPAHEAGPGTPLGAMQGLYETEDQYKARVFVPRISGETEADYTKRFQTQAKAIQPLAPKDAGAAQRVKRYGIDLVARVALQEGETEDQWARRAGVSERLIADDRSADPVRKDGENDATYAARVESAKRVSTKLPNETEAIYQARLASQYPRLEGESEQQWRTRMAAESKDRPVTPQTVSPRPS